MDIEWKWDQDDEFLGEKLPADTLDRKKYAQYLYQISAARGENANLVINLNAEWGAGKTYFTKRLAKTISDTHPTIYIDSWKEDFSDDPLLTVFSSIKEQLTGQSDDFTLLINKTIENIGPLLKTATPVIIDGLVKKLTGVESISDLTKNLSDKLLEIHSEKSTTIDAIKKGISSWVELIKRKDCIDKNLPIFVIIDELDRCRPDFSINLLEITKHIFNIPGVVFIIATDTEQLQHSIKVVYGNDFSASHYLSRFFDRRFLLPSPKLQNLLLTKSAENIISNFDSFKKSLIPSHCDFPTFINNCASILQSMKVNLRDAIKIYERLTDIIITTKKNFDSNLMLMLLALNFKNYEYYSKLKNNESLKPHESIPSHVSFAINLTVDLSYQATDVAYLTKSGELCSNRHENKDISTDVTTYFITAKNILNAQNIITIGNRQSNIIEGWLNGDLTAEDNLQNYLKMGYAHSKMRGEELKINHYFELIELSTTFE